MKNIRIYSGIKKASTTLLLLAAVGGLTGCSQKETTVFPEIKVTNAPAPYVYTVEPTSEPEITATPYVLTASPVPTATVAPTPVPQVGNLRACSGTKVINKNGVNMRFGPGTDYMKLGQLNKGDRCTCIAEYKDWSIVMYWDTICFIKSEFLDTEYAYASPYTYEEDFDIVYATSGLNFRLDPEVKDGNKIELIPRGSEIKVIGKTSNGWYLAKYNGKIGYVSAEYTRSLKEKVQAKYPEIRELRVQSIGALKKYSSLMEYPTQSSGVVRNLDIYESVEILSEADGYYFVKVGETVGYVSKKDVKKLSDTCILIDLSEQRLRLYCHADLILNTLVSTGKSSTPTPEGNFSVKGMARYRTLTGPGYSSDVEYWMDLDTEDYGHAGGYGLHSMDGTKGKPKSHGCIREDLEDAKFVYEHSKVGTSVNIHR